MAKKIISNIIDLFTVTGRDKVEENISYLELGGTRARTIVDEYQDILNQARTSTEINAFRVLCIAMFMFIIVSFQKVKIIMSTIALFLTFNDNLVESSTYFLMMMVATGAVFKLTALLRLFVTFTKFKHFNILLDIISFALQVLTI